MTAIPWWAYLGSGILVSAFSKWVEAKSKPGDFALFFWIGILFIVVGVGKVLVKYLFSKDKKQPQPGRHQQNMTYPIHHRAAGQHPSQHQSQQHPPQQHAQKTQVQHNVSVANQQAPQHASIISCPFCGTKHYDYANYCMKCGSKMKK